MKRSIAVLLTMVLLVGCSNPYQEPKMDQKIVVAYKLELKSNKADMSGYKWIRGKTADFREVSTQEALRLINEKGTGILYFGYTDCQFCARAVPELNEAMKRTGVSVYYVDTTKANVLDINALLAKFAAILSETGDNTDGFYVPLVVAIRDGIPVAEHTTLLKNYEIKDEKAQMSEEQKKELQNIYINIFQKIAKK
ncbi:MULTISPECIES: hypothetical protein [Terrabacteria group]|uniref:hypothetical protein n=1 Tax=Bacillati TaxID=1783272 RepID=UPI001C6F2DDD|nr:MULTISPECIES: hypothetical protein [Terrabacteria group]MBW9212860.1 hypothetical protein [Trueperella sp. zg.1013]